MLDSLARVLRVQPKLHDEIERLEQARRTDFVLRMVAVVVLATFFAFVAVIVAEGFVGSVRLRYLFPGLARGFSDEVVEGVAAIVTGIACLILARPIMGEAAERLFRFERPRIDRLVALLAAAMLVIDLVLSQTFTSAGHAIANWMGRPSDRSVLPLLLFNTIVVASVTEEIMFRGLIQGTVRAAYGVGWSLVVPTVLFALVHFEPTMTYALFLLPGSFCLALAREYSGNLTPPILIHMIGNGFASIPLIIGG